MAQSEFSHLFWQTQKKEKKKGLKSQKSLLSSLKSNHYCMALGGRKWVENTDMSIKYKKVPQLKAL